MFIYHSGQFREGIGNGEIKSKEYMESLNFNVIISNIRFILWFSKNIHSK